MDYYKILGLPYGASTNGVKLRYRELSKTHHPDMGGSQLRMAEINEAYRTLSDPVKRTRYDAALRRQKLSTPPSRQTTPWPAPRPQRPTQNEPVESIFEAPIKPQKRNRRGFWWTLIVGVTSACFVAVGIIAMQGVSIASPDSSQAPADKPAPTLAVDPPADQPITASNTTTLHASPEAQTSVTPTQPTEPQPTESAAPKQKQAETETCTHRLLAFFAGIQCAASNGADCTEATKHRHNYTCPSER